MPTGIPQTLSIAEGGTGAKTASAAKTNLGIGTSASLGCFFGSATLSFGSISANTESTQTITVTGLDPASDYIGITVNWSAQLETGILVKQIWCSSLNTVSIRVANVTGSPIVPASVDVTVIAFFFSV